MLDGNALVKKIEQTTSKAFSCKKESRHRIEIALATKICKLTLFFCFEALKLCFSGCSEKTRRAKTSF